MELPFADHLLRGFILSAITLIWVLGMVRINGLSSFSKMTNFDFVATVAVGSLLAGAGQSGDWMSSWQSLLAILGAFCAKYCLSLARHRSDAVEAALQNQPVLLMRNGAFLRDAMRESRVTEDDLTAKLREANVLALADVRAVVLETTGDVSVLHGEHLDDVLIDGVRC